MVWIRKLWEKDWIWEKKLCCTAWITTSKVWTLINKTKIKFCLTLLWLLTDCNKSIYRLKLLNCKNIRLILYFRKVKQSFSIKINLAIYSNQYHRLKSLKIRKKRKIKIKLIILVTKKMKNFNYKINHMMNSNIFNRKKVFNQLWIMKILRK